MGGKEGFVRKHRHSKVVRLVKLLLDAQKEIVANKDLVEYPEIRGEESGISLCIGQIIEEFGITQEELRK